MTRLAPEIADGIRAKVKAHRERMKQIEPKFLGVDDAEARYGLSKWTLRRWAYDGRIASFKVGKRLLFSVESLEQMFSEGYRAALTEGK